ncbi:MAG TPA: hypothetical protein VL244_01150 [Alphaproteobacteria bacterium]|nr:hypothetical protein [Alphaproteobacteria bacterium]
MSPYQWLCMTSFLGHDHRFRLYAYDPVSVPKGVEVRDAKTILPRERVFFYKQGPGTGSVAGFSNLFRYKLLRDLGGWWVDTDVVCLSGDLPEGEVICARQQNGEVGAAVLKLPRGHPLAVELYAEAEREGDDLAWGQTGPVLLTRLIAGSAYESGILSGDFCYPIGWDEFDALLDPARCDSLKRRVAGSKLAHLWNEMWRRANFDYRAPPPPGSFLADLFETTDLGFADALNMIGVPAE